MKFSSATLLIYVFSGTYAAIGPRATLTIANKQIAPDGFRRSSVLANGVFPGPLITANKGASFSLDVVNQLTDPTMNDLPHWHGLFQQGSNWADGPAFVTHSRVPYCGEPFFEYSFSVPEQTGTYWYHSHLSNQYCDGLRGPIVVPISNSTLINGLGRYRPASPLAVILVKPGLRYRFRLVSISCDPNWIFSIDGHNLTIIEVDGVNHKPLTVDNIRIFAGQRYSFILNATRPVDNYWPLGSVQGFANGINSAILRYIGAPKSDPTSDSTLESPLVETSLHPLVATPVPGKPYPGGADVVLNLVIRFTNPLFTLGGASFVPPTAPVLLQILSGAQSAQDLLPPGSVYTLPPNKVVEISIPGGAAGAPHPMHLHGHNFFVIRSACDNAQDVIRDVVSTGNSTNDNTTFRFVTDNAGPCTHIDWHLDMYDTPKISKETPPLHPAAWDQLCPIFHNLTSSQLGPSQIGA
ncbi:laccase 1 [Mycena leptocephala]|nr:laccase 1 [Mycena leptocephala]